MYNDLLDQKINIKISGKAMDADFGYELKYLLDILQEIQSLIEKTYLVSQEQTRMKAADYDNLKVILENPKRGSFKSNILITIQDAIVPLLPVLAENGISIWGAIKQAFEFLKLTIDTRKEGKELRIEQSGDGIIATGNNVTITVNQVIPELANKLAPSFHNLTKNLDGENISEIEMLTTNEDGIVLTNEDNERFKRKTLLSEEIIYREGKVSASDSETYTGKIEIDGKTYPFEIVDKYKSEEFFARTFTKKVAIQCQERIKIDPSKEEYIKVVGLKIHNMEIIA